MRRLLSEVFLCLLTALTAAGSERTQQDGFAAWWKFDEGGGQEVLDSVTQSKDRITYNFKFVPGVSGAGLKFDGFTTAVRRKAEETPRLTNAFTVEAWVAVQEYPLNWVAIVDHEKEEQAGYFFGIDSRGHLGLHLAVGDKWQICASEAKLSVMKWHHVAASFEDGTGVVLYMDGRPAGNLAVGGEFTPAAGMDLLIGRNHRMLPPTDLVRPKVAFPASYSLDGILDELKIYGRALAPEEIAQIYTTQRPSDGPALEPRKWPDVSSGSERFGAVYTKLKFYPEWDALWPAGPYADIVVGFDDAPHKFVFWRGTNYNGNLVTENGIWIGDQSAEAGTRWGCAEHMSDKQNRYSHVRLVENTDARVVVHWRYGLVDVTYAFANVDPVTGWGDWADEYYYIYPDGAGVRKVQVWGRRRGYSITEPAILSEPGKRAEDSVSLEALTLANMKGETHTYSWESWPTPITPEGRATTFEKPANANITVVNTKSRYKPFNVYIPGTRILPYGAPDELRPEYSKFPTWNHWPVNMAPSDGRYAFAPDRFSSSAITSPSPAWTDGPGPTKNTCFILGLTNRPAAELAGLAMSWVQAPKLVVSGSGFAGNGYDMSQRAYVLKRDDPSARSLEFLLEASTNSPVLNPALVIHEWGDSAPSLRINGELVPWGRNFRFGYVRSLDGTDLVVWIRHESLDTVRLSLSEE